MLFIKSLTLPNVLKDKSMNFPPLNFIGKLDMAIIKISDRACASGRRYHSNVHAVNATFSP